MGQYRYSNSSASLQHSAQFLGGEQDFGANEYMFGWVFKFNYHRHAIFRLFAVTDRARLDTVYGFVCYN